MSLPPLLWRERCRKLAASPLLWILVVVAALHGIGLGWGLPASDGWDNDGIAPRDFLVVLSELFSRGPSFDEAYLHYAPVHPAILGLLTAPATVVALLRAPSLAPADVIGEITKVPYMTFMAYVARLVTLVMSLGVVYAVAKIAEEVRGRKAGWCAAAVCGVNAPFTYYAHTSNLDVPCLFWGTFALLSLTRALARREPRRLRATLCFAALAVSTKDQTAAMFILGVPCALATWMMMDAWPRVHRRKVARELAVASSLGAAVFLVAGGVLINPRGFRARLSFLLGPASQDFVEYTRDALGRSLAFRDSLLHFDQFYPIGFALFAAAGLVLVLAQTPESQKKAAGLVPFWALLSFTLLFTCTARRTEHRFLLPQMVLWSVYAGWGVEWAAFGVRWRPMRMATRGALGVAFALAVFRCAAVDANLVLDPRYDATAWLASHMVSGDAIEVYGNNVYLPVFPPDARVTRVGPNQGRSPLPGVTEVVAPFGGVRERSPRWIVVGEGWAWRYLPDPTVYRPGYVQPPTQRVTQADPDGTSFFQGLLRGERGYAFVHVSGWTSTFWPRLEIHASLAREIWIFERMPAASPSI